MRPKNENDSYYGCLVVSGRNKIQKVDQPFFKDWTFCRLLIDIPLKSTVNLANQNEVGWPNVEIGWKMANDQLLFLALGINFHALKKTKTVNSQLSRLLQFLILMSKGWSVFIA